MIYSRLTPGLLPMVCLKNRLQRGGRKDGISQEDVAHDGQIIQAAGSQQIGHTDKDEQSGKDEDKKKRAKSKLTTTQQMKAEFMDWNRVRKI